VCDPAVQGLGVLHGPDDGFSSLTNRHRPSSRAEQGALKSKKVAYGLGSRAARSTRAVPNAQPFCPSLES
jgi:hypothetical protein